MSYFTLSKSDFEFYMPYFLRSGRHYGQLDGMPLDGLVAKIEGYPRLSAYFSGGVIDRESFCLSIAEDADTPYYTVKSVGSKDRVLENFDKWKIEICSVVDAFAEKYREKLTTIEIVPFTFETPGIVVRLKLDEKGFDLQAAYSNNIGFGHPCPTPGTPDSAVLAAIRRASMTGCRKVALLDFTPDKKLWKIAARDYEHFMSDGVRIWAKNISAS